MFEAWEGLTRQSTCSEVLFVEAVKFQEAVPPLPPPHPTPPPMVWWSADLKLHAWSGGARTLNIKLCPCHGDMAGVARCCGALKPSPLRMGLTPDLLTYKTKQNAAQFFAMCFLHFLGIACSSLTIIYNII